MRLGYNGKCLIGDTVSRFFSYLVAAVANILDSRLQTTIKVRKVLAAIFTSTYSTYKKQGGSLKKG